MTHADATALAARCKLTLRDYDDEREMLWVVDDVSYVALVARLRKLGAWPGIVEYDPRRPGQIGIVFRSLDEYGSRRVTGASSPVTIAKQSKED